MHKRELLPILHTAQGGDHDNELGAVADVFLYWTSFRRSIHSEAMFVKRHDSIASLIRDRKPLYLGARVGHDACPA